MEFSPRSRKATINGASSTSKTQRVQQLKGGCKQSLGTKPLPYSSSPHRKPDCDYYMGRFMSKTNHIPVSSPNNENRRPNYYYKSPASSRMNTTDGIWRMGGSPKQSHYNPPLRTYGRNSTPRKRFPMCSPPYPTKVTPMRTSSSCSKADLRGCIPRLPLNSSVTVTPVTTMPRASCSSNSTPSMRRLSFDKRNISNNIPTAHDENEIDDDIFLIDSTRNTKRKPLTPIKTASSKKSSILRDVSPSLIDKAYNVTPTSPSEKENVPVNALVCEKQIPPHLLGFPNLGNTCYLNAVLQSLVSVRVFRNDVSSCVQQQQGATPDSSLLFALAQLFSARRVGTPHVLRQPLRLIKENFEKLDSSFIGWKMQDANEFLTKILDTVKDEVDELLSDDNKTPVEKNSVEDCSSRSLSVLQWSPFKPNTTKLLNNSVVIRSISLGDTDCKPTVTDNCSDRGVKRALADDEPSQSVGCPPLASSTCDGVASRDLSFGDCDVSFSNCDTSQHDDDAESSPQQSNAKRRCSIEDCASSSSSSPKTQSPNNTKKTIDQAANPITANFGFQLHEVYQCLECSASVKRCQDYFSLYVHLSCGADDDEEAVGPASIKEAVAHYMKQEQRELKCEQCGHNTAQVTTRFTRMPRILIIQVKRYKFNTTQYSSLKVCSTIEVNKRLDLSRYTDEDTSPYPAVAGGVTPSLPSTPCKTVANTATNLVVTAERKSSVAAEEARPFTAAAPDTTVSATVTSSDGIVASSDVPVDSSDVPVDSSDAAIGSSDAAVCASDAAVCSSDITVTSSDATGGSSDVADNDGEKLTEDQQFREAIRRSLEDSIPSPVAAASGSEAAAAPVITLDEEEEDDLQKAIRLSLQDAQQLEDQQFRLEAKERDGSPDHSSWTEDPAQEEQADEDEEEEEEEDSGGTHSYRLASIVSHFGQNTTAGHYICDVLHEAGHEWLHYDDEVVTEVRQNTVLGESRKRNGYIFFYVHRDLLLNP